MRCYLMSVSRPSPTKIQKQHLLKEMRRKGNPPILLVNVNWYSHYGEKYGGSLKTKNWATISSVHALSCVRLCNPMNASLLCLSISPWDCLNSCSLSQWCHPAFPSSVAPSPIALNFPQHQSLFQWVSFSHQVAKLLELQLQHQSFQWIFRTDIL